MNILFLMADEFRHDAAGFAGNSVARTPHLDGLAAGARIFTNAHTPAPVCVPARQCLATGKYPHQIGCLKFGDDLAPGAETFARWFTDQGYYTVACGKLHHRGPDQMQGWMHRIGSETAVRWPGPFSGRSQIGRRKWAGAADLKQAGSGVSPLGLHDDYTVQGACDFLHMLPLYDTPADAPIFLMVSLQQPHFPLVTEEDLLGHYLEKAPVFWNQEPSGHPALDRGRLGPEEGITEEDVRRATAAYHGMVEQTDRRIGRVLSALESSGHRLEDWTVIFCSDHGEMLGQHGVWEKRKFYDGSVKVPLFIRAPGLEPGRSGRICSLVDLFPTLCTLAGLPVPGGLPGHDLLDATGPDVTFSHYNGAEHMVRERDWKLLRFDEAPDVLFDLRTDPGETRNCAEDPACADALARLRHRLAIHLSSAACTSAIP